MSNSSNQATTSVTTRKSFVSLLYFLNGQSFIIWLVDCTPSSQWQFGLSTYLHVCINSLHLPCLVLMQLSLVHIFLSCFIPAIKFRVLLRYAPYLDLFLFIFLAKRSIWVFYCGNFFGSHQKWLLWFKSWVFQSVFVDQKI